MRHSISAGLFGGVLLLAVGCRTPARPAAEAIRPAVEPAAVAATAMAEARRTPPVETVARVSYSESINSTELELSALIAEVLAVNPTLEAMTAAWQAAAQRYPQVTALDDPTFMAMTAPGSWNSSNVETAYVLGGAQKLPWPGKRSARGSAASAEQNAAMHELADSRLQIVEATQLAYLDYFLASRQLELNQENAEAVRQYHESAMARYRAAQVTQQDVLQAEVELLEVDRRRLELQRMERMAQARINTLLRRDPGSPLPTPAAPIAAGELAPPTVYQQLALARRGDLFALSAKVQAEQARLALAEREFYPDVEVFGRYDSFWQPAATQSDLRGQVGLNMNVPLYRAKRQAAVCEAMFRVSQRRAEYDARLLETQYEVQAAYEQVRESRQAIDLFEQRYLPVAEQNLATARTNYTSGRSDFLSLTVAQRQLITLRERSQQATTDYHRRLAELERRAGGPLPESVDAPPVASPTNH